MAKTQAERDDNFVAFMAGLIVLATGFIIGGAFDSVITAHGDKVNICKVVNAKPQGDVCIRDGKVVYTIPK